MSKANCEGCHAGALAKVDLFRRRYLYFRLIVYGLAGHFMGKAHYVYVLRSEPGDDHHYVGRTADLQARLQTHNQGGCTHTAKFRPWYIETAIAFRSEEKAISFELYLKSGSGREFSRRHF